MYETQTARFPRQLIMTNSIRLEGFSRKEAKQRLELKWFIQLYTAKYLPPALLGRSFRQNIGNWGSCRARAPANGSAAGEEARCPEAEEL